MQERLSKPANRLLRQLCYEEWDPAKTHGYDPQNREGNTELPMHYGNYESDLPNPQISFTHPQGENIITRGKRGDGTTTQHRRGFVIVQCWGDIDEVYGTAEVTADQITDALREEVERIVHTHERGDHAETPGLEGLWSEWEGAFPDPEDDEKWQSQVTVYYEWTKALDAN